MPSGQILVASGAFSFSQKLLSDMPANSETRSWGKKALLKDLNKAVGD